MKNAKKPVFMRVCGLYPFVPLFFKKRYKTGISVEMLLFLFELVFFYVELVFVSQYKLGVFCMGMWITFI